MRFMVMAISERNGETAAAKTEYTKSLQKAGVLLALDELFPPSTGARITFVGGKPAVTDGASAKPNEAIGGYWIIQVRSREEAIEWAKRAPMSGDEVIEVRQIHETHERRP